MKYFPYFIYYRLYELAQKREDNFPILVVLPILTMTTFFNVYALLSLFTIFIGVDATKYFDFLGSKTIVSLLWFSSWSLLLWGFLKIVRVHEKAYSPEVIAEYKKQEFRNWWVTAYLIGSFVTMALFAWVAGRRLEQL